MSLKKFHNYLKEKGYVPEKQIPYYINWVTSFLTFCGEIPVEKITDEHVNSYSDKIFHQCEDWQVKQAREAIGLYRFVNRKNTEKHEDCNLSSESEWKLAAEEIKKMLRLKQRSYRTEKTYINWLRDFYRYSRPIDPQNLNDQHLKEFLTYLAAERRVAKVTQNQAFNALLFFYRHVIDVEVGSLANVVRAQRGRRLPTVLSKTEVEKLFDALQGISKLLAKVI